MGIVFLFIFTNFANFLNVTVHKLFAVVVKYWLKQMTSNSNTRIPSETPIDTWEVKKYDFRRSFHFHRLREAISDFLLVDDAIPRIT